MSKEIRRSKHEKRCEARLQVSSFVILSHFVIRLSSFARRRSGQDQRNMFKSPKSGSIFLIMSDETPHRPEDESSPRSDAAIGRAFRRSLGVLLLVGAAVAAISFVLERKQPAKR